MTKETRLKITGYTLATGWTATPPLLFYFTFGKIACWAIVQFYGFFGFMFLVGLMAFYFEIYEEEK